jgi:serine/threonine protein kinase
MVTGGSTSECDPCSVRWLAPELLFPEESGLQIARRTKETDIYAFAMVMYEVSPLFFPNIWLDLVFIRNLHSITGVLWISSVRGSSK